MASRSSRASRASGASGFHPGSPETPVLALCLILLATLAWGPVGCGGEEAPSTDTSTSSTEASSPQPAAGAEPGEAPVEELGRGGEEGGGGDEGGAEPLVIFLGDSLTAGYGLSEEQAFPALVEGILEGGGTPVRVVNAGVSGDTTAGGLARLDWLLTQEPDLLVVGLGGNDGLRGLDLETTEENLRQIVRRAREAGARVLLLGMKIPPNYGADYTRRFEALYPEIAEDLEVPLLPFLLEGVAADPELNLPDGIHPNRRGQELVAETVAPWVERALDGAGVEGAEVEGVEPAASGRD